MTRRSFLGLLVTVPLAPVGFRLQAESFVGVDLAKGRDYCALLVTSKRELSMHECAQLKAQWEALYPRTDVYTIVLDSGLEIDIVRR